MATDLGKAYVQIMPSAQGISGSISKMIEPEAASAGKGAGKSLMSSMVSSMDRLGSTLTDKITKPAAIAATAVTGLVGALGFRRLIGMDNARAKLQGLGIEGKQLEQVMEDARNAVTGTTHLMAEGVDAAAGALAAGVKEGAELERYIKLVGDAATGSNRPMGEMAMIFNRIQGGGRLMRQELNMIEMGMPGFEQALAKSLNVPVEEMRNMVTAGKVSSEEFLDVMDDFAGGMSKAMAGTWQGITKNIIANIGIIGESLLSGVFDLSKEQLGEFLQVLRDSDKLKDWATETGKSIRSFAETVIENVKQMKKWWDDLSPAVQDAIKKFVLFGSVGLVAIGPILKWGAKIGAVISTAIGLFGKAGGAIAALSNPIGLTVAAIAALTGAFTYFFNTNEEFQGRVIEIWQTFKETMVEVWESFVNFIMPAVEAVSEFIQDIWSYLTDWWGENNSLMAETASDVWGTIVEIIEGAMFYLEPLIETVWAAIEVIVLNTWDVIKGSVMIALDLITGIIETVMHMIRGDWEKAWESIQKTFTNVWSRIREYGGNIVNRIRDLLIEKFEQIKQWITRKLEEAKQNAINKFNEMRSRIVDSITRFVSNVKKKFTETKNAMRDRVREAVKLVIDAIAKLPGDIIKKATDFYNAGKKIVTSIADGIKGAIGTVTNAIGNVASKVRGFLPFSPPKEGPLMDVMKVDWGGTIAGGILKGEDTIARAMHNVLDFKVPQSASFNDLNYGSNLQSQTPQQSQPIVLQVDGQTFAQIMGDYTSAEGGNRIRKIERGLA